MSKIKENSKSLVILVMGILFISGVALAYSGSAKIVCESGANCTLEEATSEAQVGGMTAQIEYFQEGIVEGGLTLDLSVVGLTQEATSTAMQICQYKSIEYTVTASSTGVLANTLHLPSSDALINGCLYTENDSWTVYFSNENTAAATTTTLAIGSGDNMELLEADGSDVIIPGGEDAVLHFRNAGDGIVKTTVTSVRATD